MMEQSFVNPVVPATERIYVPHVFEEKVVKSVEWVILMRSSFLFVMGVIKNIIRIV